MRPRGITNDHNSSIKVPSKYRPTNPARVQFARGPGRRARHARELGHHRSGRAANMSPNIERTDVEPCVSNGILHVSSRTSTGRARAGQPRFGEQLRHEVEAGHPGPVRAAGCQVAGAARRVEHVQPAAELPARDERLASSRNPPRSGRSRPRSRRGGSARSARPPASPRENRRRAGHESPVGVPQSKLTCRQSAMSLPMSSSSSFRQAALQVVAR